MILPKATRSMTFFKNTYTKILELSGRPLARLIFLFWALLRLLFPYTPRCHVNTHVFGKTKTSLEFSFNCYDRLCPWRNVGLCHRCLWSDNCWTDDSIVRIWRLFSAGVILVHHLGILGCFCSRIFAHPPTKFLRLLLAPWRWIFRYSCSLHLWEEDWEFF